MEGTIAYAGNMNQTMAGGMGQQQQAPVSEEEMGEFIQEQVNQKLNKKFSLVDFDELEGVKLLGLLSELFGSLRPDEAVDFNDVPQADGAAKMMQFLTKTLNYKVPPMMQHNFPQGFSNGDKTVLYPVFYWMLKAWPQCEKRVYLAQYLTRVEVPDDIRNTDDGVRDLYQHYESLRADFIQTHKRVDALKEAHADPTEARRKVANLEQEKDRLSQYIQNAMKKLSSAPDQEALLNACKNLRVEQEDQLKRNEKFAEQQQGVFSAQKRHQEIQQRLQNVQRDLLDPRISVITSRLNDEIAMNKMKLEEQLPKELNEKRAQNAQLQRLINEPLDISSLSNEFTVLDREIAELTQQVNERQRPGDDGNSVSMMKAQVQRVTKKKNEILSELQNLHNENNRLMQELRQNEQNVDQFRNSKMLKGEDFRKYSNQVRSKTAATKTMKARLNDLRAEWGVLQYTDKALKDKMDSMQSDIEAIERQMGMTGYVQASENLALVAQQKNEAEQNKGKTLDELSRVVQEFTVSIRERRGKLAPQILELRNQRASSQEIETEWQDKKSQFEYQEGVEMQDVIKLEEEIGQLSEECKTNEALYHRIKAQSILIEQQLKRAEDERKALANELKMELGDDHSGMKYPTYQQMMAAKTTALEESAKKMQTKRREIEDNFDNNLQQVEYFAALKKILDAKVASLRNGPSGGDVGRGNNLDKDIANIMGQTNTRGVDMLVLGNN